MQPETMLCPKCHEKVEEVVTVKFSNGTTSQRLVQCVIGKDFAEHVGTCPAYLSHG